ncbi:LuxR C-terminal-related transcriptional regulator [Flavobacterium sp. LMO8]|uniref:LuxR C-terminal-related transcriptional regulator n=1 Tax=Flavobacterium sp. LMO8 TaxID=2654244 RepID=UPI00139682FF|nr:LuxR C-terminal-related transcriptional regulator [Flavobacterium sp. LMO8]
MNTNLKEAESLLQQLEKSNSKEELLPEINFRKMIIYRANEDYNKSIQYGLLALKEFEKQKISTRLGDCYYELGESYKKNQDSKKALENFFNAEKNISYYNRAALYNSIGHVYVNIKDYKTSMNYFIKADAIATKNKDEKILMKIYNSIGFLNNIQNNKEEALKYYYKSLAISEKIKDYSQMTFSYNNIGSIQASSNQIEKSLQTLLKNKENFKKLNQNSIARADLNFNIANLYIELNQIQNAYTYLELVENYVKLNPNSKFEFYLPTTFSEISLKETKYDEAITFLYQALSFAKKIKNNELISLTFIKLSNIYKIKGDYVNAFKMQSQYIETNNKVIQEAKENDTKELQLKYEIDQYENNIKTQKQEIELLKYKSSQSKYQYAILILLILGLAFFVIRQNNIIKIKKRNEKYLEEINQLKEENYNNEVEFKNKQVTEFALQIQEQNNLLLLLKKNLSAIKNLAKESTVLDEVQKIQMMINDTIVLNNEKVQLNSEVEDTQKSFLFKLKSNFPDLNEKEIQITTLLRLNFNTKQIATQLGIAEHSIHNYRYSIRKKLNLDKEENLVDFLKNL